MPNALTALGLEVKTRAELEAEMVAAFQAIYGVDINLSQDTPDGQVINIFIQSYLDLLDLVKQVYSSFDPDNAFGVTLDQRIAINGIQRQAGTYTITDISVVIAAALNLVGLDVSTDNPYTISDNAGNEWVLITSQTVAVAGTYVYSFRSKLPGARLTIPNTITTAKTVVLGVTSVNNPTAYSSLGLNEETDQTVKQRRRISVSLSSQGYLAGLLAALENINGITSAFVYENVEAGTSIDGVPGHSIWVIVAGTAPDSEVADAIYKKRNAGCGMFGAKTYTVTQIDGTPFLIKWDEVTAETLFIQFNVSSLDVLNAPDIATIRTGLAANFIPAVNEQVNINDLATLVQSFDNNSLVTLAGFGLTDLGPFSNVLSPSAKNKQFSINYDNIIILPMILSPVTSIVGINATEQFTPLGGYGLMTYSMDANPSGGSVDPAGLYTAGPIAGTDIVRVTDAHGNSATATVTVI